MDIPINFAINVKSQGHKSMHYQNFFQKWISLIPGKILLNNLDDLFSVVSEKKINKAHTKKHAPVHV